MGSARFELVLVGGGLQSGLIALGVLHTDRSRRVALVEAGPLLERDDLTRAEALCRALGYQPRLGPNTAQHYGYFAGTDDQRLADLNGALRDPDVDAIWCIRGG